MVVAALGLLVMTGVAQAAEIQWRNTFQDALAEAARADRLVMIDFYNNDCDWCQRMDKETLTDAAVVQGCTRVIPVRVNVEETPAVARTYSIEGVPTFVFVEGSGAEVGRIEGYMPANLFLDEMGKILDEQDKTVALRKKVAAEPTNYDAKRDLARIYVSRRQGEQAAPLVDALAALPKGKAPKDMAELLLGTGVAFGSRGDNDNALKYLQKVIDGYPGTEEAEWAEFFTGLALGLKGQRQAAIKQLEKVAEQSKNESIRARARMLLERFKAEPAAPTL